MKRSVRVLALLAALAVLLGAAGCQKLRARDQLNKGVQAFKGAKYEEAIEHFKNSVALDPTLMTAKLYLATAYAQQYIPGADTPENNRNAEQAIAQFEEVLKANPPTEQKVNSLKGIASLYFNMKQLDKAREYYQKIVELDPNDPETYYTLAVIDWTETYQPRMEARAKLGLQPTEPLKDRKVCEELRAMNLAKVESGMKNLERALQLRPEYDDAMAYMNLMYREKADIECGNPEAAAEDRRIADSWVDKTMATKKAKAEKQQTPGGIVLEQQGK
ncbi:MAG: tetratricopeptide repeat protein [Terriglobales bacterium]